MVESQTQLFDDRIAECREYPTHYEVLNGDEIYVKGISTHNLFSSGKQMTTKKKFEKEVKDSFAVKELRWVK